MTLALPQDARLTLTRVAEITGTPPSTLRDAAASGALRAIKHGRTGYVLATEHATPMRPSNLRRMVKSVASCTSVGDAHPHELRHTAAVNLLRAGVDPATAASITRHSITTLLRIYHRVTQEGKREAMAKVASWMQRGLKSLGKSP